MREGRISWTSDGSPVPHGTLAALSMSHPALKCWAIFRRANEGAVGTRIWMSFPPRTILVFQKLLELFSIDLRLKPSLKILVARLPVVSVKTQDMDGTRIEAWIDNYEERQKGV